MEQLLRVSGIAAPMLRDNIDTDQIIPVPEMTRSTEETHARWGAGLFAYQRYLGDREPNPDFILNREPWCHAKILLAGRNFGCGSSREMAPRALRGFGFRAVIAPSFAGIFFNNCFRNGVVPVRLPMEVVQSIADQMLEMQGAGVVAVDIERQEVTAPDNGVFKFEVPVPMREILLSGLDEIGRTLRHAAEIRSFEDRDRHGRPWIYAAGQSH